MSEKHWSRARVGLLAAKVAWIIAHVLVLVWSLRLDAQQRFEEQILVFYVLNVLSFPSGYLFFLLFQYADSFLLGGRILQSLSNGWPTVLFQCAFFFVVGYAQWFKLLLPFLIAKVQEYDNERRASDTPNAKKQT